MPFESLFQALEETPLAIYMSESAFAFPFVECLHVVALTFVVGTIAMIDLRLLGVAAKDRSITQLSGDILPWTWGSFLLALITGLLMFASRATSYMENLPFLLKMGMLGLAALNMLYFHFATWKSVATWDDAIPTPTAVKVAGALSLTFWVLIVTFGRWIGFV